MSKYKAHDAGAFDEVMIHLIQFSMVIIPL